MTLANCSRCGRVFPFQEGGRDFCPTCVKEEEDHYRKVFQFLSTRPAATSQEISEATGIDIKEIHRFARENRLRLVKTDGGPSCESCGAPISQGKVCDPCRLKLSADIKNDLDNLKKNLKKEGPQPGNRPDPKFLKERRGRSSDP